MDWCDTVFIVLRKRRVSFLHEYHHMSVPFFGWLLAKMCPEIPTLRLFIILNTFIHFIMYGYYFLSTFPNLRRYLWWKRYITQMQLGQFIIFGLYSIFVFYNQTGYPAIIFIIGSTQPLFFFYMFYDFYRMTYNRSKQLANCNSDKKLE